MSVLHLRVTQHLSVSADQAWAFFSDPRNLVRLTPPWLDLEITSPLPDRISPGTIICYRLRPFPGLSLQWVTEITHADPPRGFVDEQRLGPYRFRHHQHRFRETTGGVEVEDLVHYALPFGAVGRLIGQRAVARRLEGIFTYRRHVLDTMFNPREPFSRQEAS